MATSIITVLICGGGNGAHTMAGLASTHANIHVRVLTIYEDEAERWNETMKDGFIVHFLENKKETSQVQAKPFMVTKDTAEAVRGCDVIVLVVPAFAHEPFLRVLKPYIKPGIILVGLPGQSGLEYEARHIWGLLFEDIVFMNFQSLPWACRIRYYGKEVDVLGTKQEILGAVYKGSNISLETPDLNIIQQIIGTSPVLVTRGHPTGITLMSTNAYIHPSIMYGKWNNWQGNPLDEVPLFYQGIDDKGAKLLADSSQEAVNIAKAILERYPSLDLSAVTPIYEWFMQSYGDVVGDTSSLKSVVQTNAAYAGLLHPMEKADDGKFLPDFKYRYLTEDIPFGLAVVRGIGEIIGVATPAIDKIIYWGQNVLNKEFLVNGCLIGKDVSQTRAPQKYGIKSMKEIVMQ